MAKMKTKKIIALLLACCLASSLVGCGGSFGNDAAAADGAASGGSDTITAIANSEGVVYCSADTYSAGLRDAFISFLQGREYSTWHLRSNRSFLSFICLLLPHFRAVTHNQLFFLCICTS